MAELSPILRTAAWAGKSRTLAAVLWVSLRTVARSAGHTLGLLWLEVTGFFFLVFSVVGGMAAWKEYGAYQAGAAGPGRTLAAALFALLFAYFGVTSFWQARRKARVRSRCPKT